MCDLAPVLCEILSELRLIRRAVEPRCATAADEKLLLRLLPAIAGCFGSAPFVVRELVTNAAIKTLLGEMTSTQVGALFSRAASNNTVADGLTIERLKREHSARLWCVVRVVSSYAPYPTPSTINGPRVAMAQEE